MRAFVAGATGHTGKEVVKELRSRGLDTVAHVRADSSRLSHWRAHFEALGASVDTTAWDEGPMRERLTMLAPSLVFGLLGTTKKRAQAARAKGADDSYETVDYGLSALLLRASIACGSRPRFVYLSSMGVGPKTTNAYLAVRHRLETELRASGLPWVIARPSFIRGEREESRPVEALGASVGDAMLSVVGALGGRRLRERYASMSNIALARALVLSGLDPKHDTQFLEADALRAIAE